MANKNPIETMIGRLAAAKPLLEKHPEQWNEPFLGRLQSQKEKEPRTYAEEGPAGIVPAILFNFGMGPAELHKIAYFAGVDTPTEKTRLCDFIDPVLKAAA